MEFTSIFFSILASFIVSATATAFSLPLMRSLKILDDPKKHKHPAIIHKKPIPRGGGIPLFIGMFIPAMLFLPFTPMVMVLFLSAFIALIVGVLDDKYDISPYLRFGVNIFCAILVVWAGTNIPFITNPLGGILHLDKVILPFFTYTFNLTSIIAIIWIVWVTNMINWSTGVDGQMPGIVAISAIVIGILSLRFPISDENTFIAATLSFIIAGSSLGFLLFNFYPARIFPGYGATAMYMLLAVVSILSGVKLATAIMVMAIPMIDGIVTITRRIATGHSPFKHDNKHFHHLLLRLGLDAPRIALFYWIVSAIFGLVSLMLPSRGKLFAILMIAIVTGGAILALQFLMKGSNDKKSI
ncbi:MAG: undecaprenyl/decaprenyl-phosphate alpha-N-acetylglucosaminyl 1-phosphate transferase [Candidatus Levyibacteriota bacterium]|nr:MAG: undecaprenyl/decaprenyl-phosphate alpha-N-acetylglucosaminyl 1-phosphate transferase [Candidatus Levybacteria bacterium]